jgi:hypothetical protein
MHRVQKVLAGGLLVFAASIASISGAEASCPPFHTLTNGTTADADDVMDNFNYTLTCSINMGIGQDTSGLSGFPSQLLQVSGTSGLDGSTPPSIYIWSNSAGTWTPNVPYAQLLFGNADATGGSGIKSKIAAMAETDTGGPSGLAFFTKISSTLSEAMRITGAGNVGIGTSTPDTQLVLTGPSGEPTTASHVMTVSSAGTAGIMLNGDNTNASGEPAGAYIQLNVDGNTDFSSGGQLAAVNTAGKDGTGANTYANTLGNAVGLLTFGARPLQFGVSGAVAATITTAGNFGIGTTTPAQALEVSGMVKVDTFATATATALCVNANVLATCSSSQRYKEGITDATFGLAEVMQLRPVTFKWKGRDEKDFGLVAEEVAKVDPLFATYKDGKVEGVKYAQLTALLINAVKDLKSANDRQAAQIAELQKQVGTMQRRMAAARNSSEVQGRLAALEKRVSLGAHP